MNKRIFSICLDPEIVDAIDSLRGNISRSQYINNILRYEMSQKPGLLEAV